LKFVEEIMIFFSHYWKIPEKNTGLLKFFIQNLSKLINDPINLPTWFVKIKRDLYES